ncbi:MAG: hypothetical protein R3266_14680 [Gemmatimonadota bacterium]|nr:hypothetical protein [Gemmatimonadota bacterium]
MSLYETMIVIGMALWIAVAVWILISLIQMTRLLRAAREPMGRISKAAEELNERLKPVMANVEEASERARQIAVRLRDDADDVGRTLRHASESTERMVDLVEDRVAEVAALLEVVQEEAEETFFSTASILHGFRRGSERVSRTRRITRAIANLRSD